MYTHWNQSLPGYMSKIILWIPARLFGVLGENRLGVPPVPTHLQVPRKNSKEWYAKTPGPGSLKITWMILREWFPAYVLEGIDSTKGIFIWKYSRPCIQVCTRGTPEVTMIPGQITESVFPDGHFLSLPFTKIEKFWKTYSENQLGPGTHWCAAIAEHW